MNTDKNMDDFISIETLEAMKIKMQEMEPQRKKLYTKKDAIYFLADTINDLLKKEYNELEISNILINGGINIGVRALKKYLREKEKGAEKPKRRRASRTTNTQNNEDVAMKKDTQLETKSNLHFEIPEDSEEI